MTFDKKLYLLIITSTVLRIFVAASLEWGNDEVKEFILNDPANGLNRYEYYPMLAVVPEK